MENILLFLPTDQPLLMIIIGIFALLVVVGIVKALFRMALIVAIIGAIAIFAFNIAPGDLLGAGKNLAEQSSEVINQQVKPLITEQLETAEVIKGENGTFTLKNEDFELSYSENKDIRIRIASMDLEFTLDELSNYVSKEEMQKINQKIDEFKSQAE